MALFDALDSDLDDVAARCTDDDAGVRRVAMLELAEVTDEDAVPLLDQGTGRCGSGGTGGGGQGAGRTQRRGHRIRAGPCARRPGRGGARGGRGNAGGEEGSRSAALLIAQIEHPEPFVRAAALRTVRELVTPEALPAALRALRPISPEVRREAIGVLGYLKADRGAASVDGGHRATPTPRSGAQ